jgi:hypothetical protein
MSEYYTRLNTSSKCSSLIVDIIPTLNFNLGYGNLITSVIDPTIFKDDEKIYNLIQHFEIDKIRKIALFRFIPNSSYDWHIDGSRSAAINMLLSGYDSITLMGRKRDNFFLDIEKVPYELNRYYLLNTSIHHTMFNFSEERYLLSIGIPKNFSYQDVKKYMEINEL